MNDGAKIWIQDSLISKHKRLTLLIEDHFYLKLKKKKDCLGENEMCEVWSLLNKCKSN